MAISWDDSDFNWSRDGAFLDTKYPFVIHAELNAVLNSSIKDLRDCTIYVTKFPCNECAKVLSQDGEMFFTQ